LLHDPKFSVIKDLIVPLQMEKSLLVSCLKNREIADSYRISDPSATAILDDQIIRFMGKEGMVCLPMISCGEPIGVIVLGMDELEFSNLSGQIHLLKMLTDQAAVAVRSHLSKRFQLKKILEERLDASSSLARRIIHEINNPMSIIKNYLKLLGIKLFPMDMAQDEIRIINEEIDRISQILSGLTTFSEGWIHQMEMVNVNALLSDLEKILSESLLNQHHVRLQLSLDTALPHILTDRNSLKQVLVNLIKNSAEAIQNGGDLYIRTRHIKGRFENSCLDSGYPEYVEIIVHDDGPGIPEENRNRLFEPFNSTKSGDHAGLGLSIVHNIIETLNGSITCDFEVDEGATFRILLPIGNTEKPLAGR
ncbi:MAG: ATP-binding protein, partial [Desulfatirhabdiaceae bacterium]